MTRLFFLELRAKECPELIIQNGPIIPKTTHGKYSITCNVGFEVRGDDILFCDNGVWSQPIPECVSSKIFTILVCIQSSITLL